MPLINLSLEKQIVTTTIAAFSITSLAALTAVSSVFLAFSDRPVFKKYKERGNLIVYMSLYGFTGVILMANCFIALVNLSATSTSLFFYLMLLIFCITVAQMMFIFFTIFALIYRSVGEGNT